MGKHDQGTPVTSVRSTHHHTGAKRLAQLSAAMLMVAAIGMGSVKAGAPAPTPAPPAGPQPEGLKGVPAPTPSNLGDFVANKAEAIRLGKALFWDMQVGSDGKTACASCHFQAGADSRSKNQVTPGLNRMSSPSTANPDLSFQLGGPNYQLKLDDFPFHKLSNPKDRNSVVLSSINDGATSQGVFNDRFVSTTPGASEDTRTLVPDPTFQVGNIATRKVEPRNTPTVVNAVFNFRNFWDGRAQYLFNGVNPFGGRDPNARVFKNVLGTVTPTQVRIDHASLASQASGPPGSPFEMSADGRTLMHIGKRLLTARPLVKQKVSPTDSVLGAYVHVSGNGLRDANYAAMVQAAFKPEWWNGTQAIQVDVAGNRTVIPAPTTLAANQFTMMQANFSLFFGLAVQMYETTLVSDDSPFDRYMAGSSTALTPSQATGLGLFFGKGKCANCHGGAEFTNASVRATIATPLSRMVMGNGGTAVYDEGFYNTAVLPTLEDIINGGKDPAGRPISLTGLAQQVGSASFQQMIGIPANLTVSPTERIAVNGASKTPTIRNVELTAPYFHTGGAATLRQVVEFYNRGGNFANTNIADLDPDIVPLGLSDDEVTQLVDFMVALTDDRVRLHKAPFDHPQLLVPNGHEGSTSAVVNDGTGRAKDAMLEIPATGRLGYSLNKASTPGNFLRTGTSGSPTVNLVARNSGKCVQIKGGLLLDANNTIQNTCSSTSATQNIRIVPAADGTFRLQTSTGKALEPYLGLNTDGNAIVQSVSADLSRQYWHVMDLGGGFHGLYNHANNKCLSVSAGSLANGAQIVQSSCASTSTAQQFKLQGL